MNDSTQPGSSITEPGILAETIRERDILQDLVMNGLTISNLIRESCSTALEKGWWEGEEILECCTCTSFIGHSNYGKVLEASYRVDPDCKNCNGNGFIQRTLERSFGDQIALMHSELSEALEAYRKHDLDLDLSIYYESAFGLISRQDPNFNSWVYENKKPEGIAVELADALIRIFDTCGRYNIPLEEALRLKMAYNKTRPYKHGGKKI